MKKTIVELRNIFQGIKVLFFPEICLACGRKLIAGERTLCIDCRITMPLTRDYENRDNHMRERFENYFDPVEAFSFFYYIDNTPHSRLVRNIKFHNCRKAAVDMGRWFGARVVKEGFTTQGDEIIVPLPLSRKRLRDRGFNQSEYIARGFGETTGIEVIADAVERVKYGAPQSLQPSRLDRYENVKDAFAVTCPEKIEGRHVFVLDDVVTTGSTMLSCVNAIRPYTDRISVIALSSTPKRG